MKDLRGKKALITGGALGMGKAMARPFPHEGGHVALVDIRAKELEETAGELSGLGEVRRYVCDISDRKAVYALADEVEKAFGLCGHPGQQRGHSQLQPISRKAGRGDREKHRGQPPCPFLDHEGIPSRHGERGEGHIVNMASAGGLLGVPYITDYCATKFGVIGLTESLRQEFKLKGLRKIRFTYVCPNTVATGMFAGAEPVRFTRLLTPEEVAERIVAGIKKNRSFIGVPKSVYLVPLTKALTPIPLLDLFNRIMGIATSSEHTVGRGD